MSALFHPTFSETTMLGSIIVFLAAVGGLLALAYYSDKQEKQRAKAAVEVIDRSVPIDTLTSLPRHMLSGTPVLISGKSRGRRANHPKEAIFIGRHRKDGFIQLRSPSGQFFGRPASDVLGLAA